ncbi:MAG: hypothetical protein ACR2QF_04180 [Geminicoccaceae bacterium]
MNSKDAAVEVALLEIAKDLLQASDDLAATDPSASAKLAHEAYEIGRDLGIVREQLRPSSAKAVADAIVNGAMSETTYGHGQSTNGYQNGASGMNGAGTRASQPNGQEEEGDEELFRLLDRQRAVVPALPELAPARKPSRNTKRVTFEVSTPRRSGWFSWMRSRDLHHAG